MQGTNSKNFYLDIILLVYTYEFFFQVTLEKQSQHTFVKGYVTTIFFFFFFYLVADIVN